MDNKENKKTSKTSNTHDEDSNSKDDHPQTDDFENDDQDEEIIFDVPEEEPPVLLSFDEEGAHFLDSYKSADDFQKSHIDQKRIRIKDIDQRKVAEAVLDVETRTTLFKLYQKEVIDSLTGIISTGKEANVYHGYAPDKSEVALKIYRSSTSIFKGLQMYIIGDPRFTKIKRDQRSFIYSWAKKEFKNLSRAHQAGVSVPEPISCMKDIVVMRFIGKKGYPYPLMKEIELFDPQETWEEVWTNIQKLYNEAGLVHADLSEYNIMYTPDVYLIDISQAVLLSHPHAEYFLYRDLKNITRYFHSQRVDCPEAEELYEILTEEPLPDYVKGQYLANK